MINTGPSPTFYSLLDSGEGEKLERFGDKILARPSSVCLWKKLSPKRKWEEAHAHFLPDKGWCFHGRSFETWIAEHLGVKVEARLQTNGQVGVFPEHALSLSLFLPHFKRIKEASKDTESNMLNLFGYTGMASVLAAMHGIHVTHVDLSKKALSWVDDNIKINKIPRDKLRLICEDALLFLKKEEKRKKSYNIIFADPPSFSRTSKSDYWKLEDILVELVKTCVTILNPIQNMFVITCHHPGIGAQMLSNILFDATRGKSQILEHQEFILKEENTPRCFPAGSLAYCFKDTHAGT